MVTLIFAICLVICITCFFLFRKHNEYDGFFFLGMGISGITAIVLFIRVVGLISAVSTAYIIDDKISIYEQDNNTIETSVDSIINNYCIEHSITLEPVDSLIVRISSIPELKSDALIQLVVEKYLDNTKEIDNLRSQQFDIKGKKWDLYFGS